MLEKAQLHDVHRLFSCSRQAHIAADAVRAYMSSRRATNAPGEGAAAIVVTTPTGQSHDIGAVMKSGANALALNIVYPSDVARSEAELGFLRQHLAPGAHVFAGGRAAFAYGDAVGRMGAKLFHRLADFRETLERGASYA